jgi:hypothetical protein
MSKTTLATLLAMVVMAASVAAGVEDKTNSPGLSNQGGQVRTAGGPDDFGYVFMDTAEGPCMGTYNYVDITGTGIAAGLVGVDDGHAGPFPIGFSFDFYGTAQTEFYAGSNGVVHFVDVYLGLGNVCPLPATQGTYGVNTFIGVYHDDLEVQADGEVYYQTFATCPVGASGSQCTVIQFHNVSDFGSTDDNMEFEVVLLADGSVVLQYAQPANDDASQTNGGSATVGIQGTDASPPVWGLEFSCNTPSLAPGLAVVFAPPTAQSGGVPSQCIVPVNLQTFSVE